MTLEICVLVDVDAEICVFVDADARLFLFFISLTAIFRIILLYELMLIHAIMRMIRL